MTNPNEHIFAQTGEEPGQPMSETKLVAAERLGWFRSLSAGQKALLLALVAGLLIGSLHLYFLGLSPSPFDLQVLGQTQLLASSESALRVSVRNHDKRVGVPGVPVQLHLEDESRGQTASLAQFETDIHGTGSPRLRLPDWNDGDYILRIGARLPGGQEEVRHPVKLRRSWQLSLSTDRPIYQPGQVILVRGLALRRPDLKPVTGATGTFTVLDPKGNKIFRQNGTTSKYGIASSECPLADEVTEGTYQVEWQVGDNQLFQLPHGCFEQTSSTTYPNVLALDYLRRVGRSIPAVDAKARHYIGLGYQRLLTFEVPGGGFEWFGKPPASTTLTAYGLMEFEDMARVHEVDPTVIERTSRWLLGQRQADGSWDPAGWGTQGSGRLGTTAYIAWALFADGRHSAQAGLTRDYLLQHARESHDSYTLALVCNALLAIEPKGTGVSPYLDRLVALKRSSAGGELVWWDQEPAGRTMFHGAGRAGNIETTALVSLALLAGGRDPAIVRGSLAWLAGQKDGQGTWYSTQATVLALKAILAGTGRPLGANQERRIEVALDGKVIQDLVIAADQAEVVQLVRLSGNLGKGAHRLRLTDRTGSASLYQVAFSHHTPTAEQPTSERLALELAYDRTDLKVDESLTATAVLVNRQAEQAPMVMLELPIPPGFTPEEDDLAKLVHSQAVAKVQQSPQKVLLYLRALEPSQPLRFCYRLRAALLGRVTAAPAVTWEYYNPEAEARSKAISLSVVKAN